MSTAEINELTELVNRVRSWPPESRIVLTRRILETLEMAPPPEHRPAARSVQELIGIGVGDSPPPDDETEACPTTDGAKRGWPVEKALGLLKTDRMPPDDEECRRIVEEERWRKYGS